MEYIGSNYTMCRSINFGVNFQIGTGCLFSREANWERVRFEHAGGTPLHISKASTPPTRAQITGWLVFKYQYSIYDQRGISIS